MARKRSTAEQIIGKLREAEVALAQGDPVAKVARRLGVTEQTAYRGRREDGGLRVEQAKRRKALERANARRKRLVADQGPGQCHLEGRGLGKLLRPARRRQAVMHGANRRARSRSVGRVYRLPNDAYQRAASGCQSGSAAGIGAPVAGSSMFCPSRFRPPALGVQLRKWATQRYSMAQSETTL